MLHGAPGSMVTAMKIVVESLVLGSSDDIFMLHGAPESMVTAAMKIVVELC